MLLLLLLLLLLVMESLLLMLLLVLLVLPLRLHSRGLGRLPWLARRIAHEGIAS